LGSRRAAISMYAFARGGLALGSRFCRQYTGHAPMGEWLLLFVIPSSFWIVLPLLVIHSCGQTVVQALDNSAAKTAFAKQD
jgi:hypothetical protein